jgi:hypothetical protein
MKTKILGLLAVGLLSAPMVAGATIISGTYQFSATNFYQNGPSPVDPVVGTFSITFDNSTDISHSWTGTTHGFVLHSINVPAGPGGYSYFAERDLLFIGGLVTGVGAIDANLDDWGLMVFDISSSPNAVFFAYSPIGPEYMLPFTDIVSITRLGPAPDPVPVPEPGTLALLGLGLAGLGLTLRRKAH